MVSIWLALYGVIGEIKVHNSKKCAELPFPQLIELTHCPQRPTQHQKQSQLPLQVPRTSPY